MNKFLKGLLTLILAMVVVKSSWADPEVELIYKNNTELAQAYFKKEMMEDRVDFLIGKEKGIIEASAEWKKKVERLEEEIKQLKEPKDDKLKD